MTTAVVMVVTTPVILKVATVACGNVDGVNGGDGSGSNDDGSGDDDEYVFGHTYVVHADAHKVV